MTSDGYQITDSAGTPQPEAFIHEGAAIPVTIRARSGRSASGFALIDTGTTYQMIDESLAVELGLTRLNKTSLARTAGGESARPVFEARVEFPTLSFELVMEFAGWKLPAADHNHVRYAGGQVVQQGPQIAILGRAFLRLCRFGWNGPDGSWTIEVEPSSA